MNFNRNELKYQYKVLIFFLRGKIIEDYAELDMYILSIFFNPVIFPILGQERKGRYKTLEYLHFVKNERVSLLK